MKYLVLFLSLFIFNFAHAFSVDELEVNCGQTNSCRDYKERFKTLISKYQDKEHLKESLKLFLKDGGLSDFDYQLSQMGSKNVLKINFQIKKSSRR